MDFGGMIDKIKKLEEEVNAMKERLVEELCRYIKDEPVPGVEILSESPRIAVVKFSAVARSHGNNLSPEYYISSCQAEAVMQRLSQCKSASAACNAVKEMIEEKKVQKSAMKSHSVFLNETTLKILKESELGKYAMSGEYEKED